MINPPRHTAPCLFALVALPLICSAQSQPGALIELALTAGPSYEADYRTDEFGLVQRPQMAFWIETVDGEFVTNIFVTQRSAKNDWLGEPSEIPKTAFALPVWWHRMQHAGRKGKKSQTAPDAGTVTVPDAVSGATPKTSFSREIVVPETLKPGNYVVWAEINAPLDYNETYTENARKGNEHFYSRSGQPSTVWYGVLKIGEKNDRLGLRLRGCGNPSGADGEVHKVKSSLTSARDIVSEITVAYRRSFVIDTR
jgi:hypothetical protein